MIGLANCEALEAGKFAVGDRRSGSSGPASVRDGAPLGSAAPRRRHRRFAHHVLAVGGRRARPRARRDLDRRVPVPPAPRLSRRRYPSRSRPSGRPLRRLYGPSVRSRDVLVPERREEPAVMASSVEPTERGAALPTITLRSRVRASPRRGYPRRRHRVGGLAAGGPPAQRDPDVVLSLGWLVTTARNLVIDTWRTAQRWRRRLAGSWSARCRRDRVERTEDRVHAALDRLTPLQRQSLGAALARGLLRPAMAPCSAVPRTPSSHWCAVRVPGSSPNAPSRTTSAAQ